MKQLQAKPLTQAAFRPYGDYVELPAHGAGPGFFPDLMPLPLGGTAVPAVSLARIGCGRTASMLEYHKYTAEGLMPLQGDCVIFVGAPVPGNPFGAALEAFRVPAGTFVRLNPGVVHGTQISVTGADVDVLLVLPSFTFGNDTEFVMLDGEDVLEILI